MSLLFRKSKYRRRRRLIVAEYIRLLFSGSIFGY